MFRRLPTRFFYALRGLMLAWKKDATLAEHLVCALAVVVAGIALRVSHGEWCLLALCIGMVIGAELFNTAVEQLAPLIDREHNPELGSALDMSAAAVLVVSIAAAIVGGAVLGRRLGIMLDWWPA